MTVAPQNPQIFHITHVDNLAAIIAAAELRSDRKMISLGGPSATIGMGQIKQRRLVLPVKTHPGTYVGDYVPFYFCPRSIMLFLIHCANNPDLAYKGGQGPIIHLEARLDDVVAWAEQNGRRWAISLSNAGARYAEFKSSLNAVDALNWAAIGSNDFRSPEVKEGKQAEFLLHDSFPWSFIARIGVHSVAVANKVHQAIDGLAHRPTVEIKRPWYF